MPRRVSYWFGHGLPWRCFAPIHVVGDHERARAGSRRGTGWLRFAQIRRCWDAQVVSRLGRFLDRDLQSYGRLAWAIRVVIRNVQWSRTQGIRSLIEEHDLRPARRALIAVRKQRWRRAHEVAPGAARPVFLVGVPRSGTNMMVRGLDASPEFEVYNEGHTAAFHHYRFRSDAAARALVLRSRHRFVLFKPLLDAHRVGDWLDNLGTPAQPLALWAYRDVDGRARSALTKFGPSMLTVMRDIADGPGLDRWQAQGLSAEALACIRSTDWDRVGPADAEAMFWYVRNLLFFDFGLHLRTDVLPVPYESFVAAPAVTMRRVCAFLGATWEPAMGGDIDGRSTIREPLPIEPALRLRCDALAARLDAAAVAARTRAATTSTAGGR